MFYKQMAVFQVKLLAYWNDGQVTEVATEDEDEAGPDVMEA
jgi:hypothetical protein